MHRWASRSGLHIPTPDAHLGWRIEAAERAISLVSGQIVVELEQDKTRRDPVLWNFTVLGGYAFAVVGQLSADGSVEILSIDLDRDFNP